jgi:hypothetical protein
MSVISSQKLSIVIGQRAWRVWALMAWITMAGEVAIIKVVKGIKRKESAAAERLKRGVTKKRVKR